MSSLTPPQTIQDRLEPRERLLWWDRPRQGIILRMSDLYLIPFSLLWGGFAFFWEFTVATTGNAPWFFKLWGVPFVLIGVYLIAGRFLHDAWRRNRLFYGLTDNRVLIATPKSCRTMPLESLGEIQLDERGGGEGSIAFGRDIASGVSGQGWQIWSGTPTVPTFEGIKEARTVFAAIREAQKRVERVR